MRTNFIPTGHMGLKILAMIAAFVVGLISHPSCANTAPPVLANPVLANLEITITGIKKQQGNLRIAIFKSKKDWLSNAASTAVLPVNAEQATYTANDIPYGTYGIAIFHDVNGNKKMDRNFVGLPKEPYGFSNNARGAFGPPKWKKSKVAIEHPQAALTICIK